MTAILSGGVLNKLGLLNQLVMPESDLQLVSDDGFVNKSVKWRADSPYMHSDWAKGLIDREPTCEIDVDELSCKPSSI